MIHQPCELTVHLLSEDIFIHPPAPDSELPGNDQTLRGVVEIKAPSDRTIHGLKITLQGIQTLGIPDAGHPSAGVSGLRWEEKLVMDKSMEITSDGQGGLIKHHKNRGKGKGKEKASHQTRGHHDPKSSESTADPEGGQVEDGIHLTKGVHG